MSILKIADLSFCETNLNNAHTIKGGISSIRYRLLNRLDSRLLLPIEESEVAAVEESIAENGNETRYFYDNETDSNWVIVSKETANGKVLSGIVQSDITSGKYVASFAFASS